MAKQNAVSGGQAASRRGDRHLQEVERKVPGPVPRSGAKAELEGVQDPRRSSKVEGVGDPGSELGGIGEAANLKKEGVIGQAQVFRSPGGGVIRPNNWRRRVWNKAMGKAGNEDPPTPHSGRRTTASLLSAAGVPQATIQAILGHATMQRTGEYISVSKAEMQAGFAKLAAMSAPSVDTQPKPIST